MVKYFEPSNAGVECAPQISQWMRSNIFELLVSLLGKDNLCCLASGQTVQCKCWSNVIVGSSLSNIDNLEVGICPNQQCHMSILAWILFLSTELHVAILESLQAKCDRKTWKLLEGITLLRLGITDFVEIIWELIEDCPLSWWSKNWKWYKPPSSLPTPIILHVKGS